MLRFAVGVLKDRPLKTSGEFRVIKWRGETVALFKNGSMARFYDDFVPEEAPDAVPDAAMDANEQRAEEPPAVPPEPEPEPEPEPVVYIAPPLTPPPAETFWSKIKRWLKQPVLL